MRRTSGDPIPMQRRRRATDPVAGSVQDITPSIDSLLEFVVKMNASDLHLAAGVAPTVRVDGELITVPDAPVFSSEMAEFIVQSMMSLNQWRTFEQELELDFSFGRRGLGRYRVGAFRERGDASAVLRRIPSRALPLDELGLPPSVAEFSRLKQGLVLVTGPSGSGKTTTLTAIIDKINRERNVHIITIEDPIEFVHRHERAIVQQRELGVDTTSFTRALRSAFRQDPDVLLIGEMRDPETIAATVSAAETGHLVFATLHTNSAAQSIDRIVDSFPPHQQAQIRYQLSGSLAGIVSQRLVPTLDGRTDLRGRGAHRQRRGTQPYPGGQDAPARLGDALRRQGGHGHLRHAARGPGAPAEDQPSTPPWPTRWTRAPSTHGCRPGSSAPYAASGSGPAASTSGVTCSAYCSKFSRNIPASLRAAAS